MTDNRQPNPMSGLPPMLADFARKTSVGLALRLAADFGGQRKYIPMDPSDDHWLVQSLGKEAALALSEMYGREWIEIPNAAHYKSKKPLIARATGSTNEVAKEHGVTSRYVRMVRAPYDERQFDLFKPSKKDK